MKPFFLQSFVFTDMRFPAAPPTPSSCFSGPLTSLGAGQLLAQYPAKCHEKLGKRAERVSPALQWAVPPGSVQLGLGVPSALGA